MSSDEDLDLSLDDFEEFEEWEYFEEEEEEKKEKKERVPLKDRVSIMDIVKLGLVFVFFTAIFLYFRFWDFFASIFAFGNEELGQSRLLYLTFLLFPFIGGLFLMSLVRTTKILFIEEKETT
jgi:hypothetical protein